MLSKLQANPSKSTFGVLLVCLVLSWANGCGRTTVNEIEDLETVSLYSSSDQLAQTMEYIRSVNRYEMANFRDKVNSGLNRWADSDNASFPDEWQIPELASSLPEVIRQSTIFRNLADKTFFANDANYVQQSFWFREIANRVSEDRFIFHHEHLFQTARALADQQTIDQWNDPSADLLANALKVVHPELAQDGQQTSEKIQQLATAIKLFDWSVRNVHLLPARPWPDAEAIKNEALDLRAAANAFPPGVGAAGPGYIRQPWQVLTYAKGDYLERAKIFAGLCQQKDIPVFILALPDESKDNNRPYQEWLCAALIGEKAYLFDPLLGLPIPGIRPGTIATLAEAKSNPEVLSGLNLSVQESTEKLDYRVTVDRLDNLLALLVAPAESISIRMAGLQQSLAGDLRLKLTVDVDRLTNQARKIDGVTNVQLWHIPFATSMFREQVAIANSLRFDQEISSRLFWLDQEERYIDTFVQFRTARNCYLRGIYRNDQVREIRSALSYYYSFMYTDKEISQIEQDPLRQQRLGILRDVNQSFAEWQAQLNFMKNNMGLVRSDAAFFLALCNYENEKPSTSLKWLTRLRNFDDERRWAQYVPYHAGRAHEALGAYDQAIESYAKDESAQKHGSILRLRHLKQLKQRLESNP